MKRRAIFIAALLNAVSSPFFAGTFTATPHFPSLFLDNALSAAEYVVTDDANAELLEALPTLLSAESVSIVNSGSNAYLNNFISGSASERWDLSVSGSGSLSLGNFKGVAENTYVAYLGNISIDGMKLTLKAVSKGAESEQDGRIIISSAVVDNGGIFRFEGPFVWNDGAFTYGSGGGTIEAASNNYHLQGTRTIRTTAPTEGLATEEQSTGGQTTGTMDVVQSIWTGSINLNGRTQTFDIAENTELVFRSHLTNYGVFVKTGGGTLVFQGKNQAGVYQDGSLVQNKNNVASATNVISEGVLRLEGDALISGASKTLTQADGTTKLTEQWANLVPIVNNATLEFAGSTAQEIRNLSGTNASAIIYFTGSNKELTLFNDADTTYAGRIRGTNVSLTKKGTGEIQITGLEEKTSSNVTVFSSIKVEDGALVFAPAQDGKHIQIREIGIDGGTFALTRSGWQIQIVDSISFGEKGGTFSDNGKSGTNLYNYGKNLTISTTENGQDAYFDTEFNTNGQITRFDIAENSNLYSNKRLWNNGAIRKTGKGTLYLSGTNEFGNRVVKREGYSGNTSQEYLIDLQEGTVNISGNYVFGKDSGAASACALAPILLNTLSTDQAFTLQTKEGTDLKIENYVDVKGVGSHFIDVAGNSLLVEGLGGEGSLTKIGAGTLYLGGISANEISTRTTEFTTNAASYYYEKSYSSPLNSFLDTLTVSEGSFSPIDGDLVVNNLLFDGGTYLIDDFSDVVAVNESLSFSNNSKILLNLEPVSGNEQVEIFRFSSQTLADSMDWSQFVSTSSHVWYYGVDGASFFAYANANAIPEPSSWTLGIFGILGILGLQRRQKKS